MQQSIKDEYTGRDIRVRLPNGKEITGQIGGRLLRFAHVTWSGPNGEPCGVEAAWETIVNCLSNNHALRV